MTRSFLSLVLVAVVALAWQVEVQGAQRGIAVNLRTSESKDAPVGETVELYSDSHALVIGIDNYTGGWPKLSNAVKDAEAVAKELESKGFDVEFHQNLTSDQLSTVFKKFFILKGDNPGARLFIWFAGHGATVDGEGYLIPADAPVPSAGAEFKFASVALRDFGTYMRQAVSKHVYAVFDSCFAGTVFASQRALPPAAITRATTMPVRQFLTSGDADQTVSDDGTFRELFIRALNGDERADANGDGYVTASELGMFLGDRVTNLTQSLQTPRFGKLRDANFDRGDFVFLLPEGAVANALPNAPAPAAQSNTAEITFWNSIKDSENINEYDAYITQYPKGSFTALAMVKKTQLERKLAEARERARAREVFRVQLIDDDMRATGVANVRESPFPTATRVGQLEEGAVVWAVGQTETQGGVWYQVARDGVELGFVYGPLLASTNSDFQTVFVSANSGGVPPAPATTTKTAAETTAMKAPPKSPDQRLSFLVEDLLQETAPAAREPAPGAEVRVARATTTSVPTTSVVQTATDAPSQWEPAPKRKADEPPAQSVEQPVERRVATPVETPTEKPIEKPVEIPAFKVVEEPRERLLDLAVATPPSVVPDVAPPQEPTHEPTQEPTQELSEYVQRYLRSAIAGNAKAQMALGYMYENGEQVETDPQEAIRWYTRAADSGLSDAMISLALIYENGNGVSRNLTEAANWYRKAGSNGNPDAQQALGYLYETGGGVTKDAVEAAKWYERAALQGKIAAQNNLGRLYQLGIGVPKNLDQAIFWYEKAAKQGSDTAIENLGNLVPDS